MANAVVFNTCMFEKRGLVVVVVVVVVVGGGGGGGGGSTAAQGVSKWAYLVPALAINGQEDEKVDNIRADAHNAGVPQDEDKNAPCDPQIWRNLEKRTADWPQKNGACE